MKAKPFRFKQFSIFQDQCAMKVGTDGVLLGAWSTVKKSERILDIGSGTGLLPLMLAQRSSAQITGIEIDEKAFIQSISNVEQSPWEERISIYHTSLQDFVQTKKEEFDIIVSNPPFFEAHSIINERNTARSQQLLSIEQLIFNSSKLLTSDGKLFLVFPSSKKEELFQISSKYNLFPTEVVYVKGHLNSTVKRILVELDFSETPIKESTLSIEGSERHQYTEAYERLLRDYLIIF